MVGRDHHQGFTIFLSEIKCCCNYLFKIEHFTHQVFGIICMSGPVDLWTFYHEEKAFLILRKLFNGQFGGCGKKISSAIDHGGHTAIGQKKSVFLTCFKSICGRKGIGVDQKSFFSSQGKNVQTVASFGKCSKTPSGEKINFRIKQLKGKGLFHTTLFHMSKEGGGCGMGDGWCGYHTGAPAQGGG